MLENKGSRIQYKTRISDNGSTGNTQSQIMIEPYR